MSSATYRAAPPWDATDFRRRGSGLGLAIAANVLIIAVLLGLGATQDRPMSSRDVLVVDLVRASEQAPAPRPGKIAETARKEPPKAPRITPPPRPPRPLDMLVLSREDYAASDISKLAHAPSGGSAGANNDSDEVGRAPNGEVLYNAQWARRPTDAELSGYLPRNAPEGWGLIACRTIAGHRVEDCVEIGNYPPGSRLASAVRQAAWQFRVRPPRKNGQELVGAWVRIRIDYLQSAKK